MNQRCLICSSHTSLLAKAVVRSKYDAQLLYCMVCGFVFFNEPHWLTEAYAEPINRSDTGYVTRNLGARDKVFALIGANKLDPDAVFLDYAGGYGMFVRLMRDSGYDFRWYDKYCTNLFSRGFEARVPLSPEYEAVTAFEVFEHLENPSEELEKMAELSPVIIFSTTLLPDPIPDPREWWYYGLEHGQHISFYSLESLEFLAGRFGYSLTTNGTDLHVFSRKPISIEIAPAKRVPRWKFWAKRNMIQKTERAPLTQSDHDAIVRNILNER